MSVLVFETPGHIDIRAFTLMGVSAKPSTTSPIGYFGTGLKYAVASLVRMGSRPVVWIGRDRYTFFNRPDKFRGVEFDKITMRRDRLGLRGRNTDLPYTTMYGRNWEPWMVMRELEANTRDEKGRSEVCGDIIEGVDGYTRIVVSNSNVIEAWKERASVFLPEAEDGQGVQVLDRPSEYIYWRGLRVLKLQRPSLFTYNVREYMQLTEDRTLPYEFGVKSIIESWVVTGADAAQVKRVTTAENGHWEHGFKYDTYERPSDAFRSVAMSHPRGFSRSAAVYFSKHDDRVTHHTYDLYKAHPIPWKLEGDTVVDAKGRDVLSAPYNYEGKWSLVAEEIISKLGVGHITADVMIASLKGDEDGYTVEAPHDS